MRKFKSYQSIPRSKTNCMRIKYKDENHSFSDKVYAVANDPNDKRIWVGGDRPLSEKDRDMLIQKIFQ